MNFLNPDIKIVKSKGIDRPIMTCYLAGRIAGNCINECLAWRKKIVKYYKNYKGRGAYPIVFLDALNSKEADSVDKLGLTSAIPPNLIYDKDMLSVKSADVIIANMNDFMESEIAYEMKISEMRENNSEYSRDLPYKEMFFKLQDAIKNRRPNYGTNSEVAWSLWLEKPTVLIADSKKRKEILETHPFMKRASVIVDSVEELLENKWLNILYKSIAGATYE